MGYVYAVCYERFLNGKFEWVFHCFDIEAEAWEFYLDMRDLGGKVDKPVYTDNPWHLI